MTTKKQRGQCFSCGAPAETRDHVPPKGLFPRPLPRQLITVPACRKCNNSTKLDDEYFRWFVATVGDRTTASDALLRERILPRFRESPALLHAIMKRSKFVDVFTKGGIWVEKRPAFEFDRPRIQASIEKIVRGLYLHETGSRLTNVEIKDFVLNPDDLTPDQAEWINDRPLRHVHPEVFSYRCAGDETDPRRSVWFLMFFCPKALFFVMTSPAGDGWLQATDEARS